MGCQAGGLACELIVGQLEKPQVGQDWEALERSDVAAVQAEDAQVDKRHKLQAEPFQAELYQAGHCAPRKAELGHSARWLACSLHLDGLPRVHGCEGLRRRAARATSGAVTRDDFPASIARK